MIHKIHKNTFQQKSQKTSLRTAQTLCDYLDFCSVSYDFYGDTNAAWNDVVLDSRDVQKGNFFIGLQGTVHNGGKFLFRALQDGCTIVLIEKPFIKDKTEKIYSIVSTLADGTAVFCVDDALSTLQICASYIRTYEAKDTTIIGVTGSVGKTTTKHMIVKILDAVTNRGNLNTLQGMCMCILNTSWQGKKYGVFECGISEKNEMQQLVEVLNPEYVLITNVENAHIGNFPSMDFLRDEKLKLASKLKTSQTLCIPEEDTQLYQKAEKLLCKLTTHGPKSCDGFLGITDEGIQGSILEFDEKNKNDLKNVSKVSLKLLGEVNARNALSALQVADFFNIDRNKSLEILSKVKGITQRYQIVHKNPIIIDDSYNASPVAVVSALKWFCNISDESCDKIKIAKKIAVFAGMKELGVHSNKEHQKVIDKICKILENNQSDITFICIGSEYANTVVLPEFKDKFLYVQKSMQAYDYIINNPVFTKNTSVEHHNNGIIFVKGSRMYSLDVLIKDLTTYFCNDNCVKDDIRFDTSHSVYAKKDQLQKDQTHKIGGSQDA